MSIIKYVVSIYFAGSQVSDRCPLVYLLFLIPGSLPAIFIMESLMEQVAKSINKDATDIRLMNMYTQGQVISSWNTS